LAILHTEILRDRKTDRQGTEVAAGVRPLSHFVALLLVVAIVLAGSTSNTLAARTPAAEKPAKSLEEVKTPTFPYMAEITGDNVYYRSGPGTNFYECGKLKKGDKVKVVSKQFSWYRIVPPAKSFAWISMQYVDVDPANPEFGILTGDRVRVYAGSDRVRPHYSTSLLGKLNKGERVKLMGQQLDDYYKIAPPASAYLWVSTYFTKPLPPEKKVKPAKDVAADDKAAPPAKPLPAGDVPKIVKIDTSTVQVDTTAAVPAPKPVPEKVTPGSRLEQYQALQKRIEAERVKPTDQQDYKEIKKELTEIANDKNADKVARYAKKVIERVEGLELAVSVIEQVRLQNEQLSKVQDGIDKARAVKLAEISNMGKYAVTGKLQPFTLYGKGHYRIVDDSGKMLCYALPGSQASGTDLSSLIGKKVGLKGMIQPHLPTKKAMVRFSEIVELK